MKASPSLGFLFAACLAGLLACTNPNAGGGNATVNIAAQSGTIASGTAGSATFGVTTTDIAAGSAGTVAWYGTSAGTGSGSAPTGIEAAASAVASNAATVTMTAGSSAVAGSYYFRVTYASQSSPVATLTVSAAGGHTIGSAQGAVGATTANSTSIPSTFATLTQGTFQEKSSAGAKALRSSRAALPGTNTELYVTTYQFTPDANGKLSAMSWHTQCYTGDGVAEANLIYEQIFNYEVIHVTEPYADGSINLIAHQTYNGNLCKQYRTFSTYEPVATAADWVIYPVGEPWTTADPAMWEVEYATYKLLYNTDGTVTVYSGEEFMDACAPSIWKSNGNLVDKGPFWVRATMPSTWEYTPLMSGGYPYFTLPQVKDIPWGSRSTHRYDSAAEAWDDKGSWHLDWASQTATWVADAGAPLLGYEYRWENPVTIAPSPSVPNFTVPSLAEGLIPSQVTLGATTGTTFQVSWTGASFKGVAYTKYRVHYETGAGPATSLDEFIEVEGTTISFTGAIPGTTYSLVVAAVDSVGEGPASAAISVTTEP